MLVRMWLVWNRSAGVCPRRSAWISGRTMGLDMRKGTQYVGYGDFGTVVVKFVPDRIGTYRPE